MWDNKSMSVPFVGSNDTSHYQPSQDLWVDVRIINICYYDFSFSKQTLKGEPTYARQNM